MISYWVFDSILPWLGSRLKACYLRYVVRLTGDSDFVYPLAIYSSQVGGDAWSFPSCVDRIITLIRSVIVSTISCDRFIAAATATTTTASMHSTSHAYCLAGGFSPAIPQKLIIDSRICSNLSRIVLISFLFPGSLGLRWPKRKHRWISNWCSCGTSSRRNWSTALNSDSIIAVTKHCIFRVILRRLLSFVSVAAPIRTLSIDFGRSIRLAGSLWLPWTFTTIRDLQEEVLFISSNSELRFHSADQVIMMTIPRIYSQTIRKTRLQITN